MKMQNIHTIACAVSLIMLGGCASRSYVDPTQGDRARVRFSTNTTDITLLRAYDDSACTTNEQEWMRLRNGVYLVARPQRLGIALWSHHQNAAQEVYVGSDKPKTVMFFGSETVGQMVYSCAVPLTYKFEKDRDYEVAFAMTSPSCHATVYEIAPGVEGATRTQMKSFTSQTTPETAYCLEQFKKKRLY